MSHTPGPWSVFVWNGHRAISSDGSASGFGIEANGYRLPMCDLDGDIDEAEANARLISAAPDLLEALEAMHEAFKYTSHNPEEDEANRKASAAIAKARGNA